MKKRLLVLAMMLAAVVTMWAQTPQQFTYQAVVRDNDGRLVNNGNIGVKISILRGSEGGTAVYTDQQTVRTNGNGLFTLVIGREGNSIDSINWAMGPYFLKSEIDVQGGTNYDLTTVQQLLSVPYALYAESSAETQTLANVAALGNSANTQIKDVVDPTDAQDAVTKSYVDALIAAVRTALLDSIEAHDSPVTVDGAVNSLFSVSSTKQVRFSKGNLQYTTVGSHLVAGGTSEPGTWKFAEYQYEYIGSANANISSTYTGYIDLFGWGTSGWNSGANAYQPYSTSTTNSDYYPGGISTTNLTGNYANADWGVYNAISNGGNQPGMWRVLTSDEWSYLFNTRADASSKYGVATVNGVHGLVILPDSWVLPSSCTFTAGYADGWATNSYTTTQWAAMQKNGAVFLPALGYRTGTTQNHEGTHAAYPSSTFNDGDRIYCLDYSTGHVSPAFTGWRRSGFPVRLVQDAQ